MTDDLADCPHCGFLPEHGHRDDCVLVLHRYPNRRSWKMMVPNKQELVDAMTDALSGTLKKINDRLDALEGGRPSISWGELSDMVDRLPEDYELKRVLIHAHDFSSLRAGVGASVLQINGVPIDVSPFARGGQPMFVVVEE